ncbi:hypothetical protein [Serratia entomophila]|uniref:hypothetical protein n=1 Tax=Serratia entomophila TaxID=42906 RepID=UPI0021785F2E|nr:hypothetical protein [Serratia entomophila]CAI1051500.1 Uncharacterised protein [Serratia entomophila]CAI1837027.1 Uncharacterised protein [Serratia entomophila]CAI2502957.1 Uncharacterised protein [Serratia entomophila]
MKTSTKYLLPVISLFLVSCNKDEGFSPVENGGTVLLSIQLPKKLEMLPLRVMYRSNICHKKQVDGSGNSYKEPGYKTMNLALKSEGKDKGYKISLPRDGGGDCEWKLSNLTLSIQSVPRDGVSHNVPISETVIFDNNSPQRLSGSYLDVNGDLDLTGDYFPIVTTYHISGFKIVESIVKSSPDKMYRVHNGENVFFHPVFHYTKTIYAVEPKEQKIGEYMSITYPDGTTESSPFFPDYKKIQSLIEE